MTFNTKMSLNHCIHTTPNAWHNRYEKKNLDCIEDKNRSIKHCLIVQKNTEYACIGILIINISSIHGREDHAYIIYG